MNTIYNFLNPHTPIEKGLVEIFNTYDNRYGSLAIDGQVIAEIYKSAFPGEVMKKKFIKQCVKISGIPEDKLTFVYYDFESYAADIIDVNAATTGEDYDANDYAEYDDFFDFIKANSSVKFKSTEFTFLAVGVEQLEENFY